MSSLLIYLWGLNPLIILCELYLICCVFSFNTVICFSWAFSRERTYGQMGLFQKPPLCLSFHRQHLSPHYLVQCLCVLLVCPPGREDPGKESPCVSLLFISCLVGYWEAISLWGGGEWCSGMGQGGVSDNDFSSHRQRKRQKERVAGKRLPLDPSKRLWEGGYGEAPGLTLRIHYVIRARCSPRPQFRVGCPEFLSTFSQACTTEAHMGIGPPGAALCLQFFSGISQ